MKSLESKLIDSVLNGNKKYALIDYSNLIHKHNKDSRGRCRLRSLKSYLICINSILYNISADDESLNDGVYKKRNTFIFELDQNSNPESIYNLGKEIILYYSDLYKDKYSLTCNTIVNQALNYIHNNLNKNLSLEEVANEIHISKSHLCNLFPSYLNCSFSNYINKAKVEYGKKLLRESSKSLLDIAFECGFNSQSYFCSTFRKIEGITPLQYKKKVVLE